MIIFHCLKCKISYEVPDKKIKKCKSCRENVWVQFYDNNTKEATTR